MFPWSKEHSVRVYLDIILKTLQNFYNNNQLMYILIIKACIVTHVFSCNNFALCNNLYVIACDGFTEGSVEFSCMLGLLYICHMQSQLCTKFLYLGSLHVVWQVSLGCWITWSISNWHNPYNRVSFGQAEFFWQTLFFWKNFCSLRTELSAKWILSILSDLPLSRETKTNIYSFSFTKLQFLNDKIYSYTKKSYLALGSLAK